MAKDYSDIAFKDDGRLKLLIIVGTRPEVIRLSEVIKKCRRHFDCLLAHTGRTMITRSTAFSSATCAWMDPDVYLVLWGRIWARPLAISLLPVTSSCTSAA